LNPIRRLLNIMNKNNNKTLSLAHSILKNDKRKRNLASS